MQYRLVAIQLSNYMVKTLSYYKNKIYALLSLPMIEMNWKHHEIASNRFILQFFIEHSTLHARNHAKNSRDNSYKRLGLLIRNHRQIKLTIRKNDRRFPRGKNEILWESRNEKINFDRSERSAEGFRENDRRVEPW